MKFAPLLGCGILITAVLLTGCDTQPTVTEQDFGNSVRAMVEAQKVQPDPAAKSAGMDGVKTEQVLKTYRQDVSKPTEIKNEIQINVGNK